MMNKNMKNEKLFDMSGKTVIITGAAGLLGSQYAEGLSAAGANVVLADIDYKTCKQISSKLSDKNNSENLAIKLEVASYSPNARFPSLESIMMV